jgi:hypothetical protein
MLSLIKDGRVTVWKVAIDDDEMLAGMTAVGVAILVDLPDGKNYEFRTDRDLSPYRLVSNMEMEQTTINAWTRFEPGQIAVWLRGSQRYRYSLYVFPPVSTFFQGLISMCNSYQVDFRNYLLGLPFDNQGRAYTLNGYDMIPYRIAQSVKESDDVEEEEKDDENILEPLKKDY